MVKATLRLEPSELDRYRGVFASVPELIVTEGTEDRVEVGDQHRPLTILPRLPVGSDPTLAAHHLASTIPVVVRRTGGLASVLARNAHPY